MFCGLNTNSNGSFVNLLRKLVYIIAMEINYLYKICNRNINSVMFD